MSASRGDLVAALECAARAEDAALFDASLDRLLESARDEADPENHLQALVAKRLQGTLSGVRSGEIGAATRSRGSRVVPVGATAPQSMGFARGLGLLAVGVAIGFSWGRLPLWWSSERGAALDGAVASAPGPNAPASLPALADGARLGVEAKLPTPSARAAPYSDADAADSKPNALLSKPAQHSRPTSPRSKRDALRSNPDALRFALEQLRKAQLLLRASEPKRALAALDLLDARVQSSVLEEEREVTRTLALCDAGNVTAASAVAQRLLERAPGSAYAVSLRESCAGKAVLLDEMRERTSNPSR